MGIDHVNIKGYCNIYIYIYMYIFIYILYIYIINNQGSDVI